MLDSLFGTGKMEKLMVIAMERDASKKSWKPSSDPAKLFQVKINPDSYTINHHLSYTRNNTPGKQKEDAHFDGAGPRTIDFSLLFDGTGAIPESGPLSNVPVVGAIASLFGDDKKMTAMQQVDMFVNLVYNVQGETHEPTPVRIGWGTHTFDGVLVSMSLNYKLFDTHGDPLRIEARVSFEHLEPEAVATADPKLASPDLTHTRTVIAGDKLPLMANKIYGTTDYYIAVAKSNRLFNFRKLKEGKPVYFPPTKKTAS